MLACVRTFVFCQIRALACVRVAHTIGPFHTAGPTPQIIRGNGIISNVIDVGPRPTALLSRDTVLRQVVRIRGAARSATRVGLTFEAVSSTQGNAIRSVMRAGGWAGRREDSVVRSLVATSGPRSLDASCIYFEMEVPQLGTGWGEALSNFPCQVLGSGQGSGFGSACFALRCLYYPNLGHCVPRIVFFQNKSFVGPYQKKAEHHTQRFENQISKRGSLLAFPVPSQRPLSPSRCRSLGRMRPLFHHCRCARNSVGSFPLTNAHPWFLSS